jgi:hypothetical protein
MRPLFSFRWRSSGSTMGWREVGRRCHARLAPVREEEDDQLGREGGLADREAEAQWEREKWPVEKKRKRAAAGPKGRKNSFSNKI